MKMNESAEVAMRRIRHELRRAYQQMVLCLDAMEIETETASKVGWLESIERAAARCDQAATEVEMGISDVCVH